jgi:acetolactate synthase-1/2/3 large subunit
MWSAQCLKIKPKCWLSSSGLGTMGYGLPASIGAKVAQQSKNVICISGDSSFQMNLQELACLSQYKLQINIFLVNNGWQGMVRQWQESFYGKRFSNSYMGHNSPCFRKLAEAYDLEYILIDSEEKFLKIINEKDILLKSILFEIKVSEGENCYPMISPGKSNKEMIGLSPDSYANQIT